MSSANDPTRKSQEGPPLPPRGKTSSSEHRHPSNVLLQNDQHLSWRLAVPDQEVLLFNALYVLTRHPLALRALESLLGLTYNYLVSLTDPTLVTPEKSWTLIIDTHSVNEWPVIVSRCKLNGGRSIILIDKAPETVDEEVRLILLGVHGIVLFEQIEQDLPKAVKEVIGGGLWVSRKGLAEYILRTNTSHLLTHREEEVAFFLRRGLSNKEIGNSLHIAERTAKFHVSNILTKCNVKSRKELLA
jgi:DNA-binding CsgD family transcriptional regulator